MIRTDSRVSPEALTRKAHEIRTEVLEMCIKAKTGHVTSSFSCAEILVALYQGGILRVKPDDPAWECRDRFLLSKGHASPILYAVLADCGFFSRSELHKFAQTEGIFGVHLQNDVPGVEITSGSLGHGLGIAAGMALAAKMDGKKHLIFALMGDGECYEGSVWEAAMFASHHGLGNVMAIVDRNMLCVTDFTEKIVKLDPLDEKFRAFGWETAAVNGHCMGELLHHMRRFTDRRTDKPFVIIANTVKGRGVPFMENVPLWHGIAPLGKEAERARKELARGPRPAPPFEPPQYRYPEGSERCVLRDRPKRCGCRNAKGRPAR